MIIQVLSVILVLLLLVVFLVVGNLKKPFGKFPLCPAATPELGGEDLTRASVVDERIVSREIKLKTGFVLCAFLFLFSVMMSLRNTNAFRYAQLS